jgi:hypothetical protein
MNQSSSPLITRSRLSKESRPPQPTQDELAGLYDGAKTYEVDCGADAHLMELIRLTCIWVWASDTRGSAAIVNFDLGDRFWGLQSGDYAYRALPVRSGK